MTQEQPSAGRPSEPGTVDRLRRRTVVGGAVLGFLATWLVFAFVTLVVYSTYGDTTSTWQTVVSIAGLLALPLVSVLLMIPRRTRHAGAGLLIGVAAGSVVGAGVCGTVLGVGAM